MPKTIIHSTVIFDGISSYPNSTVIFDSETGLIESVSSTVTTFPSSDDDIVIDGTGCTVIPGLIDAHIHVHDFHALPDTDHSNLLTRPLRCGVTTVCDMHSDPDTVHKFWALLESELHEALQAGTAGRVTQSDLKSSLYAATIDNGWPKAITLPQDASPEHHEKVALWPKVSESTVKDYIATQKANGASYIKLMQEDGECMSFPTAIAAPTQELQSAIVEEAHIEHMKVVAHALSVKNTEIVLKAGVDGLTHTFFDSSPTPEIIKLYQQTGAFLTPTLSVITSLTGENQDLREKFAEIAYTNGLINESERACMVDCVRKSAAGTTVEYAYESVRALRAAHTDIVAGTDSVAGLKGLALGPSLWMELYQYVTKCDMTAADALRAATEASARRLGFVDRGVIQAGKRADLVLVRGSPHKQLEDLWAREGIKGVWKRGIRGAWA